MMGVMIQAAFLVTAILVIERLFGEKLHAYVRYGLWLIVVIRLAMPVNLIQSPFSLLGVTERVIPWQMQAEGEASYRYVANETGQASGPENAEESGTVQQAHGADVNNIEPVSDGRQTDHNTGTDKSAVTDMNDGYMNGIRQDEANIVQMTEETNTADVEIRQNNSDRPVSSAKSITNRIAASLADVVWTVWIIGTVLTGSILGISYFRFRRRLRRKRVIYQGNCGDALRKVHVPVYLVKGLESPCLAGFLRPAVYIGAEVDKDSDTFRYAVLHEQVHYLHGDHLWAMLRMLLVTLYWFHPFVWIAAAASARDGEIACDYGTTRRIGREERYAYSEMLLAFSQAKGEKRVYSYGTMLRPGKSELKERILRLTETKKNRTWAGVFVVVCMIILAGCALTGGTTDDGKTQEDLTMAAPSTDYAENSEEGKNEVGVTEDGEDSEADDGTSVAAGEPSQSRNPTEEEQTGEMIAEAQLEAQAAVLSGETIFGADGPTLDYAGPLGTGKESIVIFHDYFGLVVYDLTNSRIVRTLNLAAIGCEMTQGDDACETAVSADGTTVWLHPRSKRYMYRYDVEENGLGQEPLVKTFQMDLEGEDIFDRYLVQETLQNAAGWESNYLYEEYKDEQGLQTAYIYLEVSDGEEQKLDNMKCVWDDMVFMLHWDLSGASEEQAANDVAFPYRYDGISEYVQIIYDKPCNYTRISDAYGSRVHPVTQEVRWHEGIDYAAEKGSDVYAAAAGVVYETGYSAKYGNYVVLLHINGQMTYYCQCDEILVEKDDHVERGSTIATVGSTGMATGPHLHFAISSFGEFVDPQEEMWVVQELE